MGFNRRKMEDERRATADAEAPAVLPICQVLEDAELPIGRPVSTRFSPAIGAAIMRRAFGMDL